MSTDLFFDAMIGEIEDNAREQMMLMWRLTYALEHDKWPTPKEYNEQEKQVQRAIEGTQS